LFWDQSNPVNSDPRRVMRTLAYQLACFDPILAEKIALEMDTFRRITSASFDMQLQHLVMEPLMQLAPSRYLGPVVIIFDALDQCGTRGSRKELLRALTRCLTNLPSMFRVLIASRDEPDIHAALSHPSIDVIDIQADDVSTTPGISQFQPQKEESFIRSE
jgi:hypothetical protein